jgi:riboflavin-specific deaminase-like protein
MVQLRRLAPDPATVTPAEALEGLALADHAPEDRPYVAVNFVASVDGRATFEGRSGPLGDEADRELFHALRGHAEAVLVGAGTLRAERYGPLVRDRSRPRPLAVTVTRTLELPLDAPLFRDPDSTIVVYTSADEELPDCPANVRVVRLDAAEMTMTAVLRRLRADHGVRAVLCEGGPMLFGALVGEGVFDELFLTISPKLAGGTDPLTILHGPRLPEPLELELVWVLEAEGTLFPRYRRRV